MSIRSVQLVKWTFPAFALIIGLFWYKRRRVDRVDPGGKSKSEKEASVSSETMSGPASNLYDSGIHIEESWTSVNTTSNQESKVMICSPRRVSDSLDIPMKNSSPHSLSIKSGKSSGDQQNWYDDEEELPEMKQVVLGSNPKSSNFDLMTRSKAPVLLPIINDDTESNLETSDTKVEEPPQTVNSSMRSSVEVTGDETKRSGQVISERDSANHSPVSGVLDGSVNDEVRSEGSTDSGKGGSINGKVLIKKNVTTYKFEIHQSLVGKLIGKRGASIQNMNAKAKVTIMVKRHPTNKEMKLCVIEGLPENITTALGLIKRVFPEKKYPELSLDEVHVATEEIPWVTEVMHLQLVEGVNNDVVVCFVVQPNRIFIQLPTHPTYPSLRLLDHNMTHFYNTVDTPSVPDQLNKGMLVVAKWYDKWVRAYVEEPDVDGLQHLVRLVDHGGFWSFSNADMRKIRSDYITLPFQAIEVSLANIAPVDGEWKQEAYDVVAQICSGSIGQAQIEGYIDSMVYINLYINMPKHGVISVADELIARGFAQPIAFEEMVLDQPTTQA